MCYEHFVCADQKKLYKHQQQQQQKKRDKRNNKNKHLEILTPQQMGFHV